MDKTFNNTDAVICGVIAFCLTVFTMIYLVVGTIKLRRKLISMGRIIPTMQMIFLGGAVSPGQMAPQPYPQYGYQNMQHGPQFSPQQPPPNYQPQGYQSPTQPPSGYYPPQGYQPPVQAHGYSQPHDYPQPYPAPNQKM